MLKVPGGDLPERTQAYLDQQQGKIDALPDYADKVEKGKSLWDSKSPDRFAEVRTALEGLCRGARRCHYCEDSVADEVEHIWPKNFYPGRVFRWTNYLYACGPCNGSSKGDKFAVFDTGGARIDLHRAKEDPVVPPPDGDAVFIDPRSEDPLDFLELDLHTGIFVSRLEDGSREHERAEYTIKVLALNTRDYLTKARRNAFGCYLDSLRQYVADKQNGAPPEELARRRQEIEERPHPTVWREMIRFREQYPELAELFTQAPELG